MLKTSFVFPEFTVTQERKTMLEETEEGETGNAMLPGCPIAVLVVCVAMTYSNDFWGVHVRLRDRLNVEAYIGL